MRRLRNTCARYAVYFPWSVTLMRRRPQRLPFAPPLAELAVITTCPAYLSSLEAGVLMTPFTAVATLGVAPLTWSITGAFIPPTTALWVSVDPATGIVTGTPSAAASQTFTIAVTDGDGATATMPTCTYTVASGA